MVLCGRLEPFLGMHVTEVGRALLFSEVDLNPSMACMLQKCEGHCGSLTWT